MKRQLLGSLLTVLVSLVGGLDSFAAQVEKGPVKVFLLVGQSNMEGKAHIRTLESLIADPETAVQYQHLKDGDTWAKRNDVWVYYPRRNGVAKGSLSVGFGDSSEKIGPELGIGVELGNYFQQQVLLIKCAWGGKSLKVDFLPPSSGGPGASYTQTIAQTRSALENLKSHFPAYDGRGYEIAGLIWFQGWNDHGDPSQYTEQLAHFIRDIRKEFNVPHMPVVIGQLGHGGTQNEIKAGSVAAAQAAVPEVPEFKGNVLCVSTREYWDQEADQLFGLWRQCRSAEDAAKRAGKSEKDIEACWAPWKKAEPRWNEIASDRPYHHCGSGRCFYSMGKAMGQGMVRLLSKNASPLNIQFTRQAVRRLLFDQDSAIVLSTFDPTDVVNLNVEYPQHILAGGDTRYTLRDGNLEVCAEQASEASLWMGGFNPFATYDIAFEQTEGNDIETGIEFTSPERNARVMVLAGFSANQCTQIHWQVMLKGQEKQNTVVPLKHPITGPFVLRVQMLGSGLNVFAVQQGVHRVLDTRDFSRLIDLRRKEHIHSFEFALLTRLKQNSSVVINKAQAALTTGVGQADMCAITHRDGTPLLDQGRLWFTMSIRGRGLDHSLQGVLSMNPSVFDIRLEEIIVFDRDDGLLRNDIASHIFYDDEADQWCGLTVGFSNYGDADKGARKQLWAVSSKRDPRFGFSVMKARDVVIPGAAEDPHLVFDGQVSKWRLLVCSKGGAGFPATLYEANAWNGPYERIAGPAKVNGTGCLLQKFGSKYYALFGSSDRKFYVYSYPDLQQLGALNMPRPPWDDHTGTRCWPNVIPLPEGYPAPYIALTMDRQNYPELSGWNYGALYLYHGYPVLE